MDDVIQNESLERFAAGTATREEARAITRHLLRGCAACAVRLRGLLRPPVAAADYGPALDSFAKACLGRPKEKPRAGAAPAPKLPKQPAARPWH